MLEDGKRLFEICANIIPNWRELSKQQLADLYIENENNKSLADAYFSALAVRCWNLIGSNYIKNPKITSPEDCYDNLMDSMRYALKHRRWLQEDSNIYQDKNGFDKALNRRMKSLRLNKYVEAMRQKNRLNYMNVSVDSIIELAGDVFFSEEDDVKLDINELKSSIRILHEGIEEYKAILHKEQDKKRENLELLLRSETKVVVDTIKESIRYNDEAIDDWIEEIDTWSMVERKLEFILNVLEENNEDWDLVYQNA